MSLNIKFLGACGTVTGSSYLLHDGDNPGVMIDLGMFMGTKEIADQNFQLLEIDATNIAGVVLTHAHLDHCGRLPLLMDLGFKGRIYMTPATRKLLELSLFDAVKIASLDPTQPALYTSKNVEDLLALTYMVEYDQDFNLGPYNLVLKDAGHILGSSSVGVKYKQSDGIRTNLVFSGDIGNYPEDLVKPTEFFTESQIVVMETTYGDRQHSLESATKVIGDEIKAVEKIGSTLLVPAFSLQRTQEILHIIDHLKKDGVIQDSTPVFLDSPMAIKATKIYKNFSFLFNQETNQHFKTDDPFSFPGLVETLKTQDRTQIWETFGPKVIIAGSGMMTGGRILEHAVHYLPDINNRLLITGYQGDETIGREILDGASEIVIEGREIPVNATVTKMDSLSSHAGQTQLLDWLARINGVKQLILTHGEESSRQVFKELISTKLNISNIETPQHNQELEIIAQ